MNNIRIERGAGLSSNYGPLLVMDGRRTNIVHDHIFEVHANRAVLSGCVNLNVHKEHRFADNYVYSFLIDRENKFELSYEANCTEQHKEYTFSFLAFIENCNEVIAFVEFSDGSELKSSYFLIENGVKRFSLPLKLCRTPESLKFKITIDSSSMESKNVIFNLSFFVIEEGLFPGALIRYGRKEGGQLFFDRRKSFQIGMVSTMIMNFVPVWSGHQLTEGLNPYFFDCQSEDLSTRVSIYADSNDFGRIKAYIKNNINEYILSSDISPIAHQYYSVALRWAGSLVDFIVNGRNVSHGKEVYFPSIDSLGDKVYVGSTGESDVNSAFCHFSTEMTLVHTWLNDQQIRGYMYFKNPAFFPNFKTDWELSERLSQFKILNEDPRLIPVVRMILGLPGLWQESPPSWLVSLPMSDESYFRDEVHRHIKTSGVISSRESFSHAGRTDLLIEFGQDGKLKTRIEFKIWGRHDYKDVPMKPLKYFTTGESVGVVVMLNPNSKKSIGSDYRNNVRSSETGFVEMIEQPFQSEGFPDNFLTLHRSPSSEIAEILHIVIDRFGPFSIESQT